MHGYREQIDQKSKTLDYNFEYMKQIHMEAEASSPSKTRVLTEIYTSVGVAPWKTM